MFISAYEAEVETKENVLGFKKKNLFCKGAKFTYAVTWCI